MAHTGRILCYFIGSVFLCNVTLKRTFYFDLGVEGFTVFKCIRLELPYIN